MSSVLGLDAPAERAGGDPYYVLDVGGALARALTAWAAHLPTFAVVAFVVYAPVLTGYALTAWARSPLALALASLLHSLLSMALTGAVTYAVLEHLGGVPPGVRAALGKGLTRLGPIWGAGLLSALGIVLGMLALVVPGLILMARWWLVVPVAVSEAPGIRQCLVRSSELTEGNRWRVFALALIMGVGNFVFARLALKGATAIPLDLLAAALRPAAQRVLTVVFQVPTHILFAIVVAVAYHDLRVGKEGTNVEELLRAFE